MKPTTTILVLSFLLFFHFGVSAQRTYRLPDDPPGIDQQYDYNWLKKASEKALENPYNRSYKFLYTFMVSFFSDHSEKLIEISKNPVLSNRVFDWAKPYIEEKIRELDEVDKIMLFTSLTSTQLYLKNFNIVKEKQYLSANESLFAWYSADDYFDDNFDYPYPNVLQSEMRSFEAFLFRRIHSGVDKRMIERFISQILSALPVNFSRKVIKENEYGYPLYEFYWDRTQFKGVYIEYGDIDDYKNSKGNGTYAKVMGEFLNGKKDGIWKYYTIYDNEFLESPKLDYEVQFKNGKPLSLKMYFEDIFEQKDDQPVKYTSIFKLDVPGKSLNTDVFAGNKLFRTFSSEQDFIDYWDIYDTHRRIQRNLKDPNIEAPIQRTFTVKDKPGVPRNPVSNNYTLYDDLKRKGKDHALLIAVDQYSNANAYEGLKNPVRDAEAIAYNLKEIYGFNCELLKNPTKQELLLALERYKAMRFDSTEQLLIFFSGHGLYDDNMRDGYLVPRDGKATWQDVSHTSCISYTELSSMVAKFTCHHTLLMIDACYSGALENAVTKLKSPEDTIGRKLNGAKVWFMNKIRFRTRMFITSSASDRMVSDGINHSPFAGMFIRALQSIKDRDDFILDVEDVFAMLNKIIPSPRKDYFPDHERESSFFFVMQ